MGANNLVRSFVAWQNFVVTRMAKIVPVKLKEPVISSGEEDEPVEEDNFQQTWQGSTF